MRTLRLALLAALALAASPVLAPAFAQDHGVKVGSVLVSGAWSRATAPGVPNGAAYLTLGAQGGQVDRLVGATTPVAERAELHSHTMDGGVMRMRPVEAIEVGPGAPTVLAPGGLHLMLMGLKQPLKQGETFPLTLRFEKGDEVTLQVPVRAIGAAAPGAHAGH